MPGGSWLKQPSGGNSVIQSGGTFRPGGLSDSDDNSDFSDDGFDYNSGKVYTKPGHNYVNEDDQFEPATLFRPVVVATPPKPKLIQPLRYAIYKGTLAKVAEGLEKLKDSHNFSINDVLEEDWTCLMFACHAGRSEIVRYLITEGADPKKITDNQSCLIPLACSVNMEKSEIEKCAELVLEYNIDVNWKESELGAAALHFAVKSDLLSLVRMLIAKGADVNACDSDRRTPLHWAATRGLGPIIKTLVNSGSDVSLLNNGGLMAYEAAAFGGYSKVSKALYDYGRFKDPSILDLKVFDENERSVHDDRRNRHGISVERNDVASVLSQLKLRKYMPVFEKQDIRLAEFLQMRDVEFKHLGVENIGDRIKLMDAIRQMHTNDWKPSSLVNFPPNGIINLPDALFLCQNVENHLKLMTASVNYLTAHALTPTDTTCLLNPGFDKGTETARIREYCGKLIHSAETFIASSHLLSEFINKIKDKVEFRLGDYFEAKKK